MPPFSRLSVLGVPVDHVTEADVLGFVRDRIQRRDRAQIVTVNAEFVMLARSCPRFASALHHAHLATPDGAGVVWAMRRQGASIERRVGGSDLIWSMCELASRHGWRVFLLGAATGVASAAAQVLAGRYAGLEIAGTYTGSPNPDEESAIADLIRDSRADILFVAFGAPAQDEWIARNLARTGAMVGMGVGGSFDYVSGRARRAPRWMQEWSLDWLWRLLHQPSRWKRMLVLPRFAYLVVRGTTRTRKG